MNLFLQALLYILSGFAEPKFSGEKVAGAPGKDKKISVELRLNRSELKDSGKIKFHAAEYILSPKPGSELRRLQNGVLQIEMTAEQPMYLNFIDFLRTDKNGYYFTEPGDEVVITSNGNGFCFSGEGAEKYKLQYLLDSLDKNIPKASNKKGASSFYIDSFEEYFAWTSYYQQKINLAIPLIHSYRNIISDRAFRNITDNYIQDVMKHLNGKFHSLVEYGISRKKVLNESLVQIYDTSYLKLIHECVKYSINKPLIQLELKPLQIQREYSFDKLRMPGTYEIMLYQLEDIMRDLKGEEQQRLLVNRLPNAMQKAGFTPAMERILETYYAMPGYTEWKKWMKEQELNARLIGLASKAPDFAFTDLKGRLITSKDLKGKVAILNFQQPIASKKMKNAVLQKTISEYKNNPGVIFVNICTEKHSEALHETTAHAKTNIIDNVVYVCNSGLESAHSVLRDYAITSVPWIWVLDSTGKVINAKPKTDFTQDNGQKLNTFVQNIFEVGKALRQKQLSVKKDGPYVFHNGEVTTACSIDDTAMAQISISKGNRQELPVQTDLDKTFYVHLQTSIDVQPAVYPEAEKLLVLSDIEGNFDAFRKLLQNNKILDENFNWIFGRGHLVFAGDMFDRGLQVTECLWLMYSMEERAKAAGGYVHFVLGNHEIMNMQGNHYYTKNKYKKNATLMGKKLTELYNENTEMGRWLRSKNIIEKIGDLLFVHGGISPEINRLPLGINDINALARPCYGNAVDSTNKSLMAIYDSRYGERYRISPFWSRGYYKGSVTKKIDKVSYEQLDTTLKKFNVSRIVTGHTIVADTISVHYGGRVINTDTHHAEGKSEALLIEGDRYYRVNDKGDKVLLFIDDKLKYTR